ncbi:MAG: iron ABC transporter permease [Bacteroidales bacterium]|nr:iron ABC transporter permease [Bacteroidales bacterium]
MFILVTVLIAFFIADVLLGSVKIPVKEVLLSVFPDHTLRPEWRTILLSFRIPKAITAILAGVALAISGLQMQTYFRNPLAGPYVLGISAGASLGVAILVLGSSMIFGSFLANPLSHWTIAVAAWTGSAIVLLGILLVSFRIQDNMTILILGILFGSITIAIVSILQYFSNESLLRSFIIWTLGSLGNVTGPQLKVMLISISAGVILAVVSNKRLNLLLLGESYARTTGINVTRTRIIIFTSTSILAGTVTAFCGPIGFIGIVVPHVTRMVFQSSNHNVVIPGSIGIGACMMLFSDIISQLPGYQQVLPINAVTAVLGIPVVIWIVTQRKRISVT